MPPRSERRARRGRSAGRILREHAAVVHHPEILPAGPPPVFRSWGRRVLGAILLFGTVSLVSCQALLAAVSPGLY